MLYISAKHALHFLLAHYTSHASLFFHPPTSALRPADLVLNLSLSLASLLSLGSFTYFFPSTASSLLYIGPGSSYSALPLPTFARISSSLPLLTFYTVKVHESSIYTRHLYTCTYASQQLWKGNIIMIALDYIVIFPHTLHSVHATSW